MGEKITKFKKEHLPFQLKYRPKYLEQLVGQEKIIEELKGQFKEGEFSRSYLLHGGYGCGKTTIARIIADYLNCKNFNFQEVKPCGECDVCKGNNTDVTEINAANATGIDDMRNLIKSAKLAPRNTFRVFIVDELHQCSASAKEAFLKPLEEPMPSTVFILCTTNPEKLPETIRSRCTKLEVKPLNQEKCIKLLKRICKKEGKEIDSKVLGIIADLSKYHPRDCVVALESVINFFKGKDINEKLKKDDIAEIVGEVLEVPPEKSIIEYLVPMYLGKYGPALQVLETVDRDEYFIKNIADYHFQATFKMLEMLSKNKVSLINPNQFYFKKIHDIVAEKELMLPPEIMAELGDNMIKTLGDVNTHLINAKQLIRNLTMKNISIVKKYLKSQKKS